MSRIKFIFENLIHIIKKQKVNLSLESLRPNKKNNNNKPQQSISLFYIIATNYFYQI